MRVVRQNWSERNRPQGYILHEDDPMILFERYLATTIERGDIYTTKNALAMLRDRVSQIIDRHGDDGEIIDKYLSSRLENVVNTLAHNHSDSTLEILTDVVFEITTPSPKVIKNSNPSMFEAPIGTLLLRMIAENAVDVGLTNSGNRAIIRLNNRCEVAIRELPPYSELWLFNADNVRKTGTDNKEAWKKDQQLDSVLNGYFSFFEKLGSEAVKGKLKELANTATYVLFDQILHIIDSIKEERYQRYLILRCLWNLEEIIKVSCEEKLAGSVSFGSIQFGVEKIESEDVAMLLANEFARIIELMARAEILDGIHVIEASVMTVYLARKFPKTTIPILNSFGIAGEIFRKAKSDTRQENLNYVCYEVLQRIDQVENAGKVIANQETIAEISLAAKNARKKTGLKKIDKSRKAVKDK